MEKLVFGWETVRIETIQRQGDALEILIIPAASSAACPLCEQNSVRVHSGYQRSLQDLPLRSGVACAPDCAALLL